MIESEVELRFQLSVNEFEQIPFTRGLSEPAHLLIIDKFGNDVKCVEKSSFDPFVMMLAFGVHEFYFVAAENKLKNPDKMPTDMKGFRAYFQLKNLPVAARSFSLNFGDGMTTSSGEVPRVKSGEAAPAAEWYDLQGRKVDGQLQKGLYIKHSSERRLHGKNGKKLVIK